LESIGFTVQNAGTDALRVQVPSFRVDVTRPRDLMEEVARLSGYQRIPTTFPMLPARGTKSSPLLDRRNRIRGILSGFGFSECINYSFISPDSCDRIGLDADDPRRRHVSLLNPISEEQAVMRTTLIPGMLEAVQRNISRQQSRLRLFEIGKVFLPVPDAQLPLEIEMLVGIWTGPRAKAAWHAREENCDFYDIKGVVEGLALALDIDGFTFTALPDEQCRYTRAGHTAQMLHDGQVLGIVGELEPKVLNSFGLKQKVFVFELDAEVLSQRAAESKQMTPIPRFPATSRDITLIVDRQVESERLLDAVTQFDESLVEDLHIFDVFTGDPIPEGKKSISFRVIYRSCERTLEDETVNAIHRNLTHRLISEFGASLPA
jgi:phenylalanyl-tRNA synthetase beta chain